MRTGRYLGNYPAKSAVMVLLARKRVRQYRPVGPHDRGRRFITTGFKTENECHSALP
jgi:hypothetical protein